MFSGDFMGDNYNYNNDYNQDLYHADPSDFCKSCYSSAKSRQGCLVTLVAAVCLLILSVVIKAHPKAVVPLLAVAAASVILKRKRSKKG